jgi:hypothetical protein
VKNLLIAVAAVWTTLAATGGYAADVVRETRAVSGFSRIEIDGQGDITLRQGKTEGLTLEATAQGLKQIRTEVRGRTLRISLVDQSHWWEWMIGGSPPPRGSHRPDPDQRIEAPARQHRATT